MQSEIVFLVPVGMGQLCAGDSTPYTNVTRFDCDAFAMDRKVIHLSKHTYQEILRSFLESKKSRRLKTEVFIGVQTVYYLTDKSLKWNFPDQQFCRFLVTTDLT